MDELLAASVYELPQAQKQALLLVRLQRLNAHHYAHCAAYKKIIDAKKIPEQATNYDELLPLAVRLFKQNNLSSVSKDQQFKVMHSSGTTSNVVSQVVLDRETAALQSKVLVQILKPWIGRQRLPMLIIDHPGLTANKAGYSARGAGVQGLSFVGAHHCYALNEDMQIDWAKVDAFVERFKGQPVLVFGFTFMVWKYFIQVLQQAKRHLGFSQGFLLHSGGWKKLQQEAVNNQRFKQAVQQNLGHLKVHNFYGMVEQTGSIFVECEQGHLHAPVFADVLIRSQQDLSPLDKGKRGLIQVLSSLPQSYPGHSILTEDIGRILGEDDCLCGRKGRYFEVLGRVAKAEARGCSDTFQ